MRQIILTLLLSLLVTTWASGMIVVWNLSNHEVRACEKDWRKVQQAILSRLAPEDYGESDSVAVVADTIPGAEYPDSLVIIDLPTEYAKHGFVEILPDSTARKIVQAFNANQVELYVTGEVVDSIGIPGEIILIAPGDNVQPLE